MLPSSATPGSREDWAWPRPFTCSLQKPFPSASVQKGNKERKNKIKPRILGGGREEQVQALAFQKLMLAPLKASLGFGSTASFGSWWPQQAAPQLPHPLTLMGWEAPSPPPRLLPPVTTCCCPRLSTQPENGQGQSNSAPSTRFK